MKPYPTDIPPRREKENMDEPQEEFLADEATPSKDRSGQEAGLRDEGEGQSPPP